MRINLGLPSGSHLPDSSHQKISNFLGFFSKSSLSEEAAEQGPRDLVT